MRDETINRVTIQRNPWLKSLVGDVGLTQRIIWRVARLADLDRDLVEENGVDSSGYSEHHRVAIFAKSGDKLIDIRVGFYSHSTTQGEPGEPIGEALARCMQDRDSNNPPWYIALLESGTASAVGYDPWGKLEILKPPSEGWESLLAEYNQEAERYVAEAVVS